MREIMVSINCNTYNHEDFIADAIEGFLMQKTNFDIEILIHDDASTDRTADIIREYEMKYPNLIKPIYQTENQYSKGVKVLNLNSKRAKGKYIALCDGDDYWTDPYKLQKQVNYMESNPECTLCAHTVKKVLVNKVTKGFERPYKKSIICPTSDMILGGGYFVSTTSLLYPRKLMENPPDFYFNASVGDYPLQIFLASKGYVFYMDEVMAAYRIGVKGGWSQWQLRGNDKRKKQINHANKVIDTLNNFNVFTDYKYADAVNKKIVYYEFKKSLLIKEVKSIRSNEYFKKLNLKRKIAVYIKIYFPSFYQRLFKNYIEELIYDFRNQAEKLD
jgi:glycosyltransferase involved in cell wall biosynthesis